MIWDNFFAFSSFSNLWKFRNRFWYQLKQMFLVILAHYKTDLKHSVTMIFHQGYCLTCYSSLIKFYYPELQETKKVLFHVTKSRYYLENILHS